MEVNTVEWLASLIPNIGITGLICWVLVNSFIKDKEKTFQNLNDSHKANIDNLLGDKEMLYEVLKTQGSAIVKMEALLDRQTEILDRTERNMVIFQQSLDKISETQVTHANKLETIEKSLRDS